MPFATSVSVTCCYFTVLQFNSHLLQQQRKSQHSKRDLLTGRKSLETEVYFAAPVPDCKENGDIYVIKSVMSSLLAR
jgi:hypothetical protein